MTRCHTLHAPAAGLFLAWPAGVTVVVDPGPDENTRRGHLAREHALVASGVALVAVAVVMLLRSGPHDRPWEVAVGLLVTAWACHVARPARRTVPAALVDALEPLRAAPPIHPGQVHRLVWDSCDLVAAEACPGTPSSHDRARDITRHLTRLHELVTLSAPDHAHHTATPEDRDREPHR